MVTRIGKRQLEILACSDEAGCAGGALRTGPHRWPDRLHGRCQCGLQDVYADGAGLYRRALVGRALRLQTHVDHIGRWACLLRKAGCESNHDRSLRHCSERPGLQSNHTDGCQHGCGRVPAWLRRVAAAGAGRGAPWRPGMRIQGPIEKTRERAVAGRDRPFSIGWGAGIRTPTT